MGRLHVLALQTGEWGPLNQVCAGFDMAIHDLAARRAGVPLHRFLAPASSPLIRAYASGIGPEDPAAVAGAAAVAGHAAFKLKVGFGEATDRAALASIRQAIGPAALLMVDANQRWAADEAVRHADWMTAFEPAWIEEPVPADTPIAAWRALRERCAIPLAGGENLDSRARFARALDAGIWHVVQPDAAKWGGVSGCLAVGRAAQAGGAVYCPDYLGGAVGLLASAHLLAAAGGEGLLEMDVNPNPWRDDLLQGLLQPRAGVVSLGDAPGIGIAPDHLFA
jgi:L-alanine-DL-glutamate epimerase-like enolase superfamily enzyme